MIYVLTRKINEYNQDGVYFVHAWTHKPSEKELEQYGCTHFGRKNNEYEWFDLEEIKN